MGLKVGLFNESFPPQIDGVANTVYNYASVINKKFGSAFVVTPSLKGVVDNYPFKVIRYSSVPLEKIVSLKYKAGNPFSITAIRAIKKEKPDIIHVHSPFTAAILAKVCDKNDDIPIVLTYHTKFEQDFDAVLNTSITKKIALKFMLRNINSVDEVWVVSKGCGEALTKIGYKGKYRVMENGTDFPVGRASEEEIEKINLLHSIDKNENVMMFCGRMMWYKNIRLILDALHLAKMAGLKFRFIFVGDGMDLEDIKSYARRLGISQNVIFTGAVYDRELLRAYYSRADLFVFPSTYDTSGLVVKEAAACSTPSILIKDSCASEGVENEYSGFLCAENAIECSNTMIKAFSDKNRLKEIGVNASEHVYLSWDQAIERAYKRYNEILNAWNFIPKGKRKDIFKRIAGKS